MTTPALSLAEQSLQRITQAIIALQQGRSNAHGSFTLATSPATSTVVTAPNCSEDSTVLITATTANAANIQRTSDLFVTAGTKQFTVTHGATANSDCTFSYAIQG